MVTYPQGTTGRRAALKAALILNSHSGIVSFASQPGQLLGLPGQLRAAFFSEDALVFSSGPLAELTVRAARAAFYLPIALREEKVGVSACVEKDRRKAALSCPVLPRFPQARTVA